MNRTTAFSALLAVLVSAAVPARAADEDVQVWIGETVSVPFSPSVRGTLDLSQRFRESGDQHLARAAADFKLSPQMTIGGGVAYVATLDAADELRPHQQLTLTFGALALRTRVEERFFEDADRMELRLRQRIGLTLPVADRLKAGLAGELFYIARSQDAAKGAYVEQWRANATLARQLAFDLEGTLGYLAIYQPREGTDKLSHVAQVTLTLRR